MLYALLIMVLPAIITFFVELIQIQNIGETIAWVMDKPLNFLLGYIVVMLVFLFIYFIWNRINLALIISSLIFITFALINYYKLLMRGDPFMPWDLMLNKEATNIVSYLDISLSNIIIGILISLVCLAVVTFLIKPRKSKWQYRLPLTGLSAVLLVVFMNSVYFNSANLEKLEIEDLFWNQRRSYEINGFMVGFGINIKNTMIKAPAGYSELEVENIKNKYSNNGKANKEDITPNIIIVMNEAFWDPTELGNVEYAENPIPTFERLRNESATGWLLAPEYGGGTANTEFEALTGHSVSFLPTGSMAYQQYVDGELDSMASFLKSNGYNTIGIHPYKKWFWDRENVYPYLGFDKFLSEDDFVDPIMRGQFISDIEVSHEIIRQYEKGKGKPFFNYTVTMQNHGPYNDKRYGDDIVKVDAPDLSEESIDILQTYTRGVKDADDSLRHLIEYFEEIKEPTIIAMFGDHLPMLGNDYLVYKETGYISEDKITSEDNKRLHLTPLVVWNNYDNKKEDIGMINAYNLGPHIMKSANMKMPDYFEMLNAINEENPSFIKGLAIDEKGDTYERLSDEDENRWQEHWMIQYNEMFGKQY